jgi:hypothetical protein
MDAFFITPNNVNTINETKDKYLELNYYINHKVPAIDSTLKTHSKEIEKHTLQIRKLNERVENLKP